MDLHGVELTWLGHAAIRLRLGDGTVVLVDPWLEGNPACPKGEHEQDRVDAIYITHGHYDHLGVGVPDLARAHDAPVFAIHEICIWLGANDVPTASGSNKGGTVPGPGGIEATLVDAIHSSDIDAFGPVAPGGQAAGWVLDIPDGPTIYHAGDTAVFGDMALIGELYRPDIALLPIGGYYTMGPVGAARAAAMLGVQAVVPIHYATYPALAGTPQELAEAGDGAFEVVAPEPGERVT